MTLSLFRKEVAKVFYHNLPEKSKTQKLMSGTDFILTVVREGHVLGRGNEQVRKNLFNGSVVNIVVRGAGGARGVSKSKPAKKDMTTKAEGYKKTLTECNALIKRESISTLPSATLAEKVLQEFSVQVEMQRMP